tara:strand:+ start:217 stop:489 length:273 start_codon:yes stop_codon:yes gene_type:complete
MFRKITTIISFKIESKFEEWVKFFDSKEVNLRHSEFDIIPLFRGCSKDHPKKIICIHQATERNIQKFIANNEWLKSQKVDFSTLEESPWI